MRLPYDRIHIVGAGGAGMSSLAKVLMSLGHELSGSDLRGGATLQGLADLGISVSTGHNPDVAVTADLVVASSAVPDYDEELEAARKAGIPTWRRPQLLAALTAQIDTIGATGTHGKTTTTAMLLSALRATGEDPSFVIGGDVIDFGTNGHLGTTELLVIEADEAFRTFESIQMNGLVITNVEPEHLEHFGEWDDLVASFVAVAEGVDGPVLACSDDEGSRLVATRAGTLTYGFSGEPTWRLSGYEATGEGSSFRLDGPRDGTVVTVRQPGRHFALNAAGALALLAERGVDLGEAAGGIASFRGVGRRWDHRGTVRGVTLVDDYAHHPTEVAATISAARSVDRGRIWAVFQPHLYSRTERFSAEFGTALSEADRVVVTDVYGAREEPVPGITGQLIVDAAAKEGAHVSYVPHRADLAEFLLPLLQEGDLVISMGAGDITLLHGELVAGLAESR